MMFCNGIIRRSATMLGLAALAAIGAWAPANASSPGTCDVSSVVARALPAIVNITVVKVITGNEEGEGPAVDADGKPAAPAAKQDNATSQPAGPHFETFVGSGAIINSAGIIITNKHVIKDAAVITRRRPARSDR